jgi:membrane protein implicated in regulation of membrane protease activity
MEWLAQLSAAHWLGIGLLLLAAEVGLGVGMGYLLGPGIAALLVALIAWVSPISTNMQIIIFVVLSLLATWGYLRYFRTDRSKDAASGLHNRTTSMLGKETRLEEGIDGNARIPFGDTLWRVFAAKAIATGTRVRVISIEDDILQVEKI